MSEPYYEDDLVNLYHGDCIEVMREMPDASVDAIVTDPPYGLGFMGRAWDDLPPGLPWARECLRVLKPGGHLLAFGGSRTWHRLAVAVEDAGFEMRDSIAWLYGSGFPKSLDVSKAIDKAAGAEREVVGIGSSGATAGMNLLGPSGIRGGDYEITTPATPEAEQWQGWGTALKPAFEPIVVARKPLVGTVAANVLAHGTGAINVDGCRVGSGGHLKWGSPRGMGGGGIYGEAVDQGPSAATENGQGRWPTNVVLDDTQAAALDKQSGVSSSPTGLITQGGKAGGGFDVGSSDGTRSSKFQGHGDSGGASRFFPTFHYEAKAPTSERPRFQRDDGTWEAHATVKPLALMRWLVRLVTPPNGTILEPFAGSGTTLEAALIEGFNVIGIEREEAYLPLIMQRIKKPLQQSLFGDTA
jgi:DNA modification methylase